MTCPINDDLQSFIQEPQSTTNTFNSKLDVFCIFLLCHISTLLQNQVQYAFRFILFRILAHWCNFVKIAQKLESKKEAKKSGQSYTNNLLGVCLSVY